MIERLHIHIVVLRLPFLVELGFENAGFLRRGENRSTRRNTTRSNGKTQQQTQPTYGVDFGIWTRPHCWEACAHTIAPPLLLEMYYVI